MLDITLEATVSETGLLQLFCVHKPHKWQLDFNLRKTTDIAAENAAAAGPELGVSEERLKRALDRIDLFYGKRKVADVKDSPKNLKRELEKILDLEFNAVRRRLLQSTPNCVLELRVSDAGKRYLLREGTDTRYGARHLKRAIERLFVQPLANLIATEQVGDGDVISVDFCSDSGQLAFWKESRNLPQPEEIAATSSCSFLSFQKKSGTDVPPHRTMAA